MKNKKGFTMLELLITIAILSILMLLATPKIVNILFDSKNKIMVTAENEVLEIAKLYVEDYCKNPINSTDYKCPTSYKYEENKYICISTLRNTSKGEKLVDDILYGNEICNGVIVFNKDNKSKTYLFCGEKGNYSYVTDESINLDDYDCPYNEETNYKSSYEITYHSNNGSNETLSQTCKYNQECKTLTNTFSKLGYSFNGWEDDKENIYQKNETINNKKDIDLYAKWKPNKINVLYYDEKGTITSPVTGTNGTTYYWRKTNSLIERSTNNSTFTSNFYNYNYDSTTTDALMNYNNSTYFYTKYTGYKAPSGEEWANKEGCTNSTYSQTNVTDVRTLCDASTSDCTCKLKVNWKPITYTVSYNANGESGSMASTTHTYDASKTLSSNTFTRSGYTFDGWNTKSDGSGTNYANGASVKNLTTTSGATITLYAKWKATVIFAFTYTGNYQVLKGEYRESDGTIYIQEKPWVIKFTSGGTFTANNAASAEAYLVGAGDAGDAGYDDVYCRNTYGVGSSFGGKGGAGGAILQNNVNLSAGASWSLTIGTGNTTAFGYTANKGGGLAGGKRGHVTSDYTFESPTDGVTGSCAFNDCTIDGIYLGSSGGGGASYCAYQGTGIGQGGTNAGNGGTAGNCWANVGENGEANTGSGGGGGGGVQYYRDTCSKGGAGGTGGSGVVYLRSK